MDKSKLPKYNKYVMHECSGHIKRKDGYNSEKLDDYDYIRIIGKLGSELVIVKFTKCLPFYHWRKKRAINKAVKIWRKYFKAGPNDDPKTIDRAYYGKPILG